LVMKLFVPALMVCVSGALAQSAAVVEGTVTDSVTHAGVAGVSVTLWTNKQSYKATTDSSGAFAIAGVNPGDYNYRFEKDGYEIRELPTFGQPRLRVGANGTFRADTEIAALATLRGRVLDPEGKPAAKVRVELAPGPTADTDEEGRFEFQEVRSGDYTLRAEPSAKTSDAVRAVPTYYPSTISLGEAEHIRVRAGADLAGYEIRLRTSPVYQVRGVVFDEHGKPMVGAIGRLRLNSRGTIVVTICISLQAISLLSPSPITISTTLSFAFLRRSRWRLPLTGAIGRPLAWHGHTS
jgi:hypothetical protein